MTWEYRIGRIIIPSLGEGLCPTEQFCIIEVYYDTGSKIPTGFAVDIAPYGESVNEFKDDLKRMTKACRKPVIDLDNFPNELP